MKFAPSPGCSLVGMAVFLWRRKAEAPGGKHGLRIPWVALREIVPILGSAFGKGGTASQGTKELLGAIVLSHSLT